MMLHAVENSVVLLIDLQERLMPAIHDGSTVVSQIIRLGSIAQLLDVPVIGTEQSPGKLGSNLQDVKSLCAKTFAKDHFNACAEGLSEVLPAGRQRVIVAGCEAHVCVLQTVFGLLDQGLEVTLLSDAVGSRRLSDRDAAISRVSAAGVEMATVEMVGFEWLRSSRHPRFRDAIRLIK